jgi:hypothetical protein
MTVKPPFGRPMRDSQFQFSPTFTPLNHGSFGAYPRVIQEAQDAFQKRCHERPDTFIVYDLPDLIDESRKAIAPYLGVEVDEVVFVPNASTAVNTVLRNLKWEKGDVVVHFSTIYGACEKTLSSIREHEPLETVNIALVYPIEDQEIVRRFRETVNRVRGEGKNVRLAMFDTVLTFPGARMPWEELVEACTEMGVLSLIDGAHGIGHIDLSHLGKIGPDFFVSNCHKYVFLSLFLLPIWILRLGLANDMTDKATGGSTHPVPAQSSTFPFGISISSAPVFPPPTATSILHQTHLLPQMGKRLSFIFLNSSLRSIIRLIYVSPAHWNSGRNFAVARKRFGGIATISPAWEVRELLRSSVLT